MNNKKLAKEYLYINQVKETIELTNVVKIRSFSIFNKNRFAVLTTHRLLIFEDKEAFLLKKACKEFFEIKSHDFDLNKTDLLISKLKEEENESGKKKLHNLSLKRDENKFETIKFPSIELCNQWWETIKFFKVKILKEDEEKLKSNELKFDINKAHIPTEQNLLKNSNQDLSNYVDFINKNNKPNKDKINNKSFAIEAKTAANENIERRLNKILVPPQKNSIQSFDYNNNQTKINARKNNLNNSYDERINFKRDLYKPNPKVVRNETDNDFNQDYLKRIKAFFNNNQKRDKENEKNKNIIRNQNQITNNNTNQSMSLEETQPNNILKTHSFINPNNKKKNSFTLTNQSNLSNKNDKYPKTIQSQVNEADNSIHFINTENKKSSKFPFNKTELNDKGDLKPNTNQIPFHNKNEFHKSNKNTPNKNLKRNQNVTSKFKNAENPNRDNSGKPFNFKEDSKNKEDPVVYNYTKYKEIPPNSNFPMIDYFKSFISNSISGNKSFAENKARTKRKMTRTQFEIISKSFSAAENNPEINENEFLYDNQNKLKNKLSYKLKPVDNHNLNNNLRHQSISFIHPIFSDENITETESKITESYFGNLNESLKIKQPIGSLRLENQLGKGSEENFVDLRRINDKFKYKDNPVLNSNEIKSKIYRLGLVKDFENLQNVLKIDPPSFPAYLNKSHDECEIFGNKNSEKKSRQVSKMSEILEENKDNRENDYLKNVNNRDYNGKSKRNLIVLKMMRKNDDFSLAKDNQQININKSTYNPISLHNRNDFLLQEEYENNLEFNWSNFNLNNPEKANKNKIKILNEKEPKSPFNIKQNSHAEKENNKKLKFTKIPYGSEKKYASNISISEEDHKIYNNQRSNLCNNEKERNLRSESNLLNLEKKSTSVQTNEKGDNSFSFISPNNNDKINMSKDLNSQSDSSGNITNKNFYQNGGINNLMHMHSNRFCFYCLRGENNLNSKSSSCVKNTFQWSSPNNNPIGFSNYLNYIKRNNNKNKNKFEEKICKHNFEKINNVNEDYILNDSYNNNFLKSKNDIFSISELGIKNLKDIGIREFYNNQKQNSSFNKSFTNTSSHQSTNRKSENNNNSLKTKEDKVINNVQKDFCNSKIFNILHKSFNCFNENKKQFNEIFNCDSVISFSKKYHVHNEIKKSFLCNLCGHSLHAVDEESHNIANIFDNDENNLLYKSSDNKNTYTKQKEVLLVRDINSDKNDFVYKRKRMSFV